MSVFLVYKLYPYESCYCDGNVQAVFPDLHQACHYAYQQMKADFFARCPLDNWEVREWPFKHDSFTTKLPLSIDDLAGYDSQVDIELKSRRDAAQREVDAKRPPQPTSKDRRAYKAAIAFVTQ